MVRWVKILFRFLDLYGFQKRGYRSRLPFPMLLHIVLFMLWIVSWKKKKSLSKAYAYSNYKYSNKYVKAAMFLNNQITLLIFRPKRANKPFIFFRPNGGAFFFSSPSWSRFFFFFFVNKKSKKLKTPDPFIHNSHSRCLLNQCPWHQQHHYKCHCKNDQ